MLSSKFSKIPQPIKYTVYLLVLSVILAFVVSISVDNFELRKNIKFILFIMLLVCLSVLISYTYLAQKKTYEQTIRKDEIKKINFWKVNLILMSIIIIAGFTIEFMKFVLIFYEVIP